MSTTDLDYAYIQLQLDDEASELCVVFYWLKIKHLLLTENIFKAMAETRKTLQEEIKRTPNCLAAALLDNIIVVTRGMKQEHIFDLEYSFKKLLMLCYELAVRKIFVWKKIFRVVITYRKLQWNQKRRKLRQ